MEAVKSVNDIKTNLLQLEAYLGSADPAERGFAQDRFRLGECFVPMRRDDGLLFGPSRFVGYRDNTLRRTR